MDSDLKMKTLRKLSQLSPRELWLLAQAVILLPVTLGGVSLLGVNRWQQALTKVVKFRSGSKRDLFVSGEALVEHAQLIARIVRIAAHHGLYRANCLPQTLVLWLMLRREGIESKICFGARKEEGQFQAHAWVECLGRPLNEENDVRRYFGPLEVVAVAARNET